MLPLIALDMESGDFSIFGALDFINLCIPCAAICGAIYILAWLNVIKLTDDKNKIPIHLRLGLKGFYSNILFGDYVEGCYPYSLEYPVIIFAVRFACIIGGALVGIGLIASSAYIPLPLSLYIIPNTEIELYIFNFTTVNSYTITVIACTLSFLIPFIVTLYFFKSNKQKKM